MEIKNVIYKYRNKINGHMYIGQTVDFKRRHQEHIYEDGIVNNSAINRAFSKYGEDNFEVEILCSAPNMPLNESKDYLNEMEKYYIWKYDTFKNPTHYNLTEGGDGLGSNENSPNWLNYARVRKGGFNKEGLQRYELNYGGGVLLKSVYKEKLQKICDKINSEDKFNLSDYLENNKQAIIVKKWNAKRKTKLFYNVWK